MKFSKSEKAPSPPTPPSGEDWNISEEDDSLACQDNLSFTHSPYGLESIEAFDGLRESPTPPSSQGSGSQGSGGDTNANKSHAQRNTCNVYISNLPSGVDEVWLRKEFGKFGLITSAKVMQAYSKKRVYAFVQFTGAHMADAAVQQANGVHVGNYALVVKHADRDKDKGLANQPSNNLYVSNLPHDCSGAQLEALFTPFGQVVSSIILTYPQTGVGRGVGLVRYFSVADAAKAILSLHGKVLDGHDRPLEVKYAENQEAKQVRKMPKKTVEAPPPQPTNKARAAKQVLCYVRRSAYGSVTHTRSHAHWRGRPGTHTHTHTRPARTQRERTCTDAHTHATGRFEVFFSVVTCHDQLIAD